MDKKNLTDADFYQQACSYFYYHAEQRTTMINFFIAVFAASIALYGTLLSQYAWVSVLVAVFITIVSIIFYFIDLRNRFDVKESQNVIEQFERDYGMNKVRDRYAYGVFSNEANVYRCYGYHQRREGSYKKLLKAYKKHMSDRLTLEAFNTAKEEYLQENENVSEYELMKSLKSGSIISLSYCIKILYIVCITISFLAIILAAFLAIMG
jgi:hypothetical protein